MEPGTRPLQCFAAVCIFIETVTFGAPPPPPLALHLHAQFPLHEPLVDANGSKTQSQRLRPVTFAPTNTLVQPHYPTPTKSVNPAGARGGKARDNNQGETGGGDSKET